MSNIKKIAFATLSAVGLFAPAVSHAAQNDPVGCTVTVNYTLNGVLRESYQNSFGRYGNAVLGRLFDVYALQVF